MSLFPDLPNVSFEAGTGIGTVLGRVCEVDPLICVNCGAELVPVGAITNDAERSRLFAYLPSTALPTGLALVAGPGPVRDDIK